MPPFGVASCDTSLTRMMSVQSENSAVSLASQVVMSVAPALGTKLPYDPQKDLAPITTVAMPASVRISAVALRSWSRRPVSSAENGSSRNQSSGPTASERLQHHGWPVDFEPSHSKMGILVKEVSEQASSILDRKR